MGRPDPIATVLVGAGQRGAGVYGAWISEHPTDIRLVAVVEPNDDRRERLRAVHGIRHELAVAELGQLDEFDGAEACIVAGPDRSHHAATCWAMEMGFHVLVEKPIAASLTECIDLVGRSSKAPGSVSVAHVLRTTRFFTRVADIVRSGRLGDIVSVAHRENVASWHMAHSFVRGNWARAGQSTPMIVAKMCHDFDVLAWMLPAPVRRLTSVGSLLEFRRERAPSGSTERCTDGCEVEACPYDARRIYLEAETDGWPASVLSHDPSQAARLFALETGPYGLCVYRANSNVVDHQAVVMELEDGADVTVTMHGHSHRESRTIRIDGTRGTLTGTFGANSVLDVHEHASGATESFDVVPSAGGHGGGDVGLMHNFISSIRGHAEPAAVIAGALEGHLLAFLAEESRITGTWIDVGARRSHSK